MISSIAARSSNSEMAYKDSPKTVELKMREFSDLTSIGSMEEAAMRESNADGAPLCTINAMGQLLIVYWDEASQKFTYKHGVKTIRKATAVKLHVAETTRRGEQMPPRRQSAAPSRAP
jgi:hypothetical protein